MSQENVEVVRGVFEATNRGDWKRAMATHADDVVLAVHGSFVPSGTFSGRADVAGWFGEWFASFESGYQLAIEEILDHDDAVVVVGAHRGRGKLSGADIEGQSAYAFWVQDGFRVEIHDDRAEALEAVGLSE